MKLSTLYSRSVNGKINTFTIHIEGNKYYTVTGFLDGVKTQSLPTVCNAKTYCTAEEQAIKEATAIHRKKMESGSFENVSDIDNETFFEPMLAHDFNKEKHKIKYPLYSQPKLDGIRCLVKRDGMWSRTGKPIISASHIFEALKPLFEINPNLIFDGELYADKFATDFNAICSLVKKTKPTPQDLEDSSKAIEYHIYDLPSCKEHFTNRYKALQSIAFPECCVLVETDRVDSLFDVARYYEYYIMEGYEGQMLRVDSKYENCRSKSLLKHKVFIDSEFIIRDVEEGIGKLKGKVGVLKFDGFNSAVNGTHEYLKELWDNRDKIIGVGATVKYFELTTDGIPRFPKVIQIDRWSYE